LYRGGLASGGDRAQPRAQTIFRAADHAVSWASRNALKAGSWSSIR
jgi:hypothetical protein